jgi:hypothetical protein
MYHAYKYERSDSESYHTTLAPRGTQSTEAYIRSLERIAALQDAVVIHNFLHLWVAIHKGETVRGKALRGGLSSGQSCHH